MTRSGLLRGGVILILLVLAGLAWQLLPRGFETDLSLIGAGQRTLVLAHDHQRVDSVELMEGLSGLRERHPELALYIVADLQTPRGQRFAANYDLAPATLVLFDRHGTPVDRLRGARSAEEIEQWLADRLPPF
jgi:hypothetical protein